MFATSVAIALAALPLDSRISVALTAAALPPDWCRVTRGAPMIAGEAGGAQAVVMPRSGETDARHESRTSTACRLLVTSGKLQVTRYKLYITSCTLQVHSYELQVTS